MQLQRVRHFGVKLNLFARFIACMAYALLSPGGGGDVARKSAVESAAASAYDGRLAALRRAEKYSIVYHDSSSSLDWRNDSFWGILPAQLWHGGRYAAHLFRRRRGCASSSAHAGGALMSRAGERREGGHGDWRCPKARHRRSRMVTQALAVPFYLSSCPWR